jgi:hypothetical protein
MTSRCCLLACLLAASPGVASAQIILVPVNPYGFGVNYTRVTPHSVLTVSLGTRGIAFGPIAPWGVSNVNQTTVIVTPPAYNPITGWPANPRGVIVDPLAVDVLPRDFLAGKVGARPIDRGGDRAREQLPEREEDRVQVRVDRPPPMPLVRRDPPPAPVPLPPMPVPDLLAANFLPPRPLDNPQAEYLRLITDGKEAFNRGEYGRASERFGQAINVLPGEGPARFLRSQAEVAIGKYLDAAQDLREGLKRFPDGLVAGFTPADVYGEKAADYPEHRKLLEQARERFPGDADLALLAAVQCWLAGERAEAQARMEKFEGADRLLVEPFLQVARRMDQP